MRDAAARSNLQFPEGFIPFDAAWLDEPIHRRFEQQVRLRPDAAAVRLPNRDVTYAELNAAANRAARRLLASADTVAKPVALLQDQGCAAVVWTLASLKAGLPYAPLDQRLPEPVLTSMLDNLDPGSIVAGAPYRQLAYRLAAGRVSVIEVDPMCDGPHDASTVANRPRPEDVPPSADLVPSDAAGTTIDLAQSVAADSIAYIFYTSGSTGTPKGVADSHRNVLHNILRYTNTLRFAPGDTLSLIQNPSFSGTVSTLFGALLNGATLAPFDLHGEGLSLLSDWLRRARVTVFHAVPSIFRQLSDPVERFPDVRLIRLEGDRASVADLRHFDANFRAGCTLVNGLGATECGLVRQFFVGHGNVLESGEPVPVGYAVPDVNVRVCDDSGQSLPMGSIGELVIESRYLAVGYWRNPALTATRFTEAGNDTRRYRTRDVGHVDADGCVTHLGRIDNAIRIAGEFVDPSAIERALLGIPGVAQTAVNDYTDSTGERRLCAHLVIDAGASVTTDRLRAALSESLAGRTVPTAFLFLDALPLTKDLKVDRARLPRPGHARPPLLNEYVAPRTAREKQFTTIWSEVLEIDQVGVDDPFFDLGGDSLRAAQVVSRLRERHCIAIKLQTLFEHPTIRELASGLLDPPTTTAPKSSAG